ncbi:MAG: insulinase family protein [Actinobacteria bacterium]|nr:insulinase family protein [Actinomycetota bacterium]
MTSSRTRTRELPATGGGVITRSELPSGVKVVTESMPGVRSVSVGVWIPVGSRDESRSLAGTSHFLEHLLFKGTSHRDALDIASAMDAVGGEFNAFTEKEHTCFYATVLDRDLPLAVDIVTDVVLNATLTARDVDIERGVVLEEIAMRDDDPADLVHDEFASTLLGDSPLGRPILGTTESISALTRRQIHGYYRRRYDPSTMVVSVAGRVDHRDVLARVRAAFDAADDHGPHPRPTRAPADPAVRPSTSRVVADDTEQANVIVGGLGLSRHDPRRFVLGVLSSALGGGMSSRLFQSIREERGLAYSVYSFLSSYADTGIYGVYAGCQPGKTAEVVSLIVDTLNDVARGGIDAAELERGKGQMRGGIVLGLEDSGSRMTRIGKSELSYGDILGVDDLLARIDAVTVDDIAVLAVDLLTRPRSLTVVGPFGAHEFDGAV